jgi:hypothetical protein
MAAQSDLVEQLRELHDDYAERINAAVAEGRDDLVEKLVGAYPDEALRLMAAAGTQD